MHANYVAMWDCIPLCWNLEGTVRRQGETEPKPKHWSARTTHSAVVTGCLRGSDYPVEILVIGLPAILFIICN
jgi:hypothetical protein